MPIMHDLASRILRFIQDESTGDFGSLALELFGCQFARNAPFRRLCESVAATPDVIGDWRMIPAVPAIAFKAYDLSCAPLEQCPAVFHSSGTTQAQASKHWMNPDALAVYEASLSRGYENAIPATSEIWAVMPSAASASHSSLSHMLQTLGAREFAEDDLTGFSRRLNERALANPNKPLTLFGTAFGLAELMDRKTNSPLPASSIVIETGGFKGRTREIPRNEFYALIQSAFSVDESQCFSEYGMCEMASQFYSRGVGGALKGPHWVRTRCIDPLTNEDVAFNGIGLLRHYDLANLNSVFALQTQDLAILSADGGFRLQGRASQSELRGCSLTAEEMWSSPASR